MPFLGRHTPRGVCSGYDDIGNVPPHDGKILKAKHRPRCSSDRIVDTHMVERFVGKVVIVTGSGAGIGKATILRFAREGAVAVVTDANPEDMNEVAAEIRSLGSQCIAIRADATKKDDVKRLVDSAIAEYGKIDVLVNNVGMFSAILLVDKYLTEMTEEALNSPRQRRDNEFVLGSTAAW